MGFPFNVGLKLYTTNVSLIQDTLRLKDEGYFDYIELYIIPDSYAETIKSWKKINVPYVIHLAHSFHGVNLAQPEKWETNLIYFNEARQFADDLESDVIIVHGGNNGTIDETIRQIGLFNESRIALENKPKVGVFNEICVGWSPEEFHRALKAGILSGTVLDFVHAVCAANSADIDKMKIIGALAPFHPRVYHLSDGDALSEKDVHLNLGKGSLDLSAFLSVIPERGFVTIETPRDPDKGLKDFVDDIHFLRTLF